MVRVNLINPKSLADQHLIAEYNEILMLLGYVIKHPELKEGEIPESYCLGKGHIKFFKNKLSYLKRRHDLLRIEMKRRGFATNKKVSLQKFNKKLKNEWFPNRKDKEIIKKRLRKKIAKKKGYYRYCGIVKKNDFFLKMIEKAK